MAAPIRPPAWPPAPTNLPAQVGPARNDARAAQKAFFDAALAGRTATAAAVAAEKLDAPRAAPAQAIRAATQVEAAEAADKLPRPGSIVDIYV